jgi:hypothetical protein
MTVYSNLCGGLGNQMFQYACGRALSLHRRAPFALVVDMFDQPSAHQGFELKRVFNVKAPVANLSEAAPIPGWARNPKVRRLLATGPGQFFAPRSFFTERTLRYQPEIWEKSATVYLHGYWQTAAYFDRYAPQIRMDLAFAEPVDGRNLVLSRELATTTSVSVHVRRGDYVTSGKNKSIYAIGTPDYYFRAMDLLLSRYPEARFYAFSDDPGWVREVLAPRFPGLTIVDHNRGPQSYIDMRLMSECRHHIIANSTFSWWGAWLNPRPDKIVVAPREWYATSTKDSTDLIPASWTRL